MFWIIFFVVVGIAIEARWNPRIIKEGDSIYLTHKAGKYPTKKVKLFDL